MTKPDILSGFGLVLFLLFFQLNATVAYVGLFLMTVVFALQAKAWMPLLQRDAVAIVYASIALYLIYYSVWAGIEFPETAEDQQKALFIWLHWLWFIPVAWHIFQHRKHINTILLILASSLLIRILVNFNWADFTNLALGQRTGFGTSATVFSPIASSILLGLLLLAPRLIIQAPKTATWMVYLKRGFWLVGLLMVLESLVLSQTRGAWLASALIFPVALLFRYKASLIRFPRLSVRSLVALALVIGLAGLWFQHNIATIINRVNSEQIMAKPEISKQQILGQDVLLTTSVGYRKILWEIGWRKAQERWLFGWGPGTTEALLKQEHNPLFSQSVTLQNGTVETLHLYHLHNLYLEFLVRFGLIGSLLLLALPVLLVANVRKAYANNIIAWDYACFLIAGWALIAIMALFDFQLYKYAWRNYCLIWVALTYAVQLQNLAQRNRPTTASLPTSTDD